MDNSIISLLSIGIIIFVIVMIVFILGNFDFKTNSKCYWTTNGMVCVLGEME